MTFNNYGSLTEFSKLGVAKILKVQLWYLCGRNIDRSESFSDFLRVQKEWVEQVLAGHTLYSQDRWWRHRILLISKYTRIQNTLFYPIIFGICKFFFLSVFWCWKESAGGVNVFCNFGKNELNSFLEIVVLPILNKNVLCFFLCNLRY